MHTFLTPEPITVEIRNATGEIRVDLADVAATTVDVTTSASHPLGFLDDIFKAVAAKGAQFTGDRKVFSTGRARSENDGFGSGPSTEPEDPADRVRVDLRQPVDGNGVATLIVDTDPARTGWKSSFSVHVTVPTNSGIRIQSQAADVTVVGVSNRLETRTASGDVTVDQVAGRAVVQTASGDVSIAATGDCDIKTASGEITVGKVGASALVHSTSGDIEIGSPAGNVNARSVSGEITVRDVVTGRTELTTVSGDVEVGIHAGTLTAVDVNTISGHTESDFEVSDEIPRPATDDSQAEGNPAPAQDPLDVAAQAWGSDPIDLDLEGPRVDATTAPDEPADREAATDEPAAQQEPKLDLRIKTTSGDVRLRRAALL
jgi:hypothetical protein